jgi:23S rRNA pseudouridine1911/1915/1917 synthase
MKKTPPFSVIFEDPFIIAVNKAPGIPVGPGRWDETGEPLDRQVSALLAQRDNPEKIHLYRVHRIDRDTSGLVVFAKEPETHRLLSSAFERGRVKKRYIAVIHGQPVWKETACDLPLVPNGNKRHLTIIDKYQGKKSRTLFRLLGGAGAYSVVEALPATGRTHQIRVHLASLGHPVVCDPLYGSARPVFLSSFKRNWRGDSLEEKPLLARLGLHAAELLLPEYRPAAACPAARRLEAPLFRDMAALIAQLEKQAAKKFEREGRDPPAPADFFDQASTG